MKRKRPPACASCPTCGRATTLYAFREIKPKTESDAYRKRIRNLVAQFELEGYDTHERDLSVACAVAQIMAAEGESDHMQQILARHMERLIASQLLEVRPA